MVVWNLNARVGQSSAGRVQAAACPRPCCEAGQGKRGEYTLSCARGASVQTSKHMADGDQAAVDRRPAVLMCQGVMSSTPAAAAQQQALPMCQVAGQYAGTCGLRKEYGSRQGLVPVPPLSRGASSPSPTATSASPPPTPPHAHLHPMRTFLLPNPHPTHPPVSRRSAPPPSPLKTHPAPRHTPSASLVPQRTSVPCCMLFVTCQPMFCLRPPPPCRLLPPAGQLRRPIQFGLPGGRRRRRRRRSSHIGPQYTSA